MLALTLGTAGNTIINFNQRYLFTQDNGQFYIDGTLKSSLSTTNTLATGVYPMYLFTNNNTGETQLRGQDVKLYGCKIYSAGSLVRDYIPVKDGNGVACLYDKVEEKFYYNSGTGTFTAGTEGTPVYKEVARKIKKGYVGVNSLIYTPVDYIESSGTQYIDTDIYPNANIHCIVDFQMNSIPTSSEIVAGAWEGSAGMLFGVHVANGLTNFEFAFGTSAWAGNTITADTNRHMLYMNDENGDGRLDNTVLASHSNVTSLTNTTYKIYLFRCNGSVTYYSKCKIYSCKIYDNDALVRDYIPVLDSNNVACLYEKVENKFYYNKGSGTFTAGTSGEAVYKDVAHLCFAPYIPIEYVSSGTGNEGITPFINTGVAPQDNICIEIKFQANVSARSMSYLSGVYQNGSGGQRIYVVGTSSSGFTCSCTSGDWYNFSSWNTNVNTIIYNDSSKRVLFNGTNKATVKTLGSANTNTLGLFSTNPAESSRFLGKVYYYKIYNRTTGNLILNYVPMKRGSDGVAGFYDTVSGNFITNQGTGNFIAGPEKT